MTHTHHPGSIPLTARLAVTAALVALAAASAAPTADARPQDGNLAGSGLLVTMPRTGAGWAGAYHVGSETAWCIDLASDHPSAAGAWTQTTVSTLPRQSGWGSGSWVPHGAGGGTADSRVVAELAWLTHTAGRAPGIDLAVAVDHAIRVRTIDGADQRAREAARWAAVQAAKPGAEAYFTRLHQDAIRYAGPYTADVSWLKRPTPLDPTGQVRVAVRAASRQLVPHVALSVTGTGSLTVGRPPVTTGATGEAVVAVTLPTPALEAVSGGVSVTASGLPGTTVGLWTPREATVQRLISAPTPTRVTGAVDVQLTPPTYTPAVTTRTASPVALAGADAVDIVSVTGGRPGSSFAGTSTLYGPFPTLADLQASTPSAAPRVGTATFSGAYGPDGAAEVRTDAGLVFPAPGYYMWVEALAPSPFITPPAPPVWPQLAETSLVVAPEVSTMLSTWPSTSVTRGTVVSDTLTLSGVPGREVPDSPQPLTITASGRLMGPVAPLIGASGPTCDGVVFDGAPVVARYTDLTVLGANVPALLSSTLDLPGCYSAGASVTVRHGKDVVITVEHRYGIPEQGVLVEAPPATPLPTPSSPGSATPTPSVTPPVRPTSTPAPPSPVPSTATPTPAPTPPTTSTPRIDSGEPIREQQLGLALLGLVVTTLSLGLGIRRSRS